MLRINIEGPGPISEIESASESIVSELSACHLHDFARYARVRGLIAISGISRIC